MGEGGKAVNLRELATIVPVPPFVVAAADGGVAEVERRGLVPPYAVRSSADVEDGTDAAFAGMFETRLDVSPEDLERAIAEVLDSASSPRVEAYVAATGAAAPAQIRAVVQTMVDARVSGVCATRLPEGPPERISIEAVWGLGELLVSGEVEPDRVEVRRDTCAVTFARLAPQLVEMTVGEGKRPVPPHRRQARKLAEAEAEAVADMALAVESHFGWSAVDLEWAFDDDELWALQARPIASMAGVEGTSDA